jgi:hypothetical protein
MYGGAVLAIGGLIVCLDSANRPGARRALGVECASRLSIDGRHCRRLPSALHLSARLSTWQYTARWRPRVRLGGIAAWILIWAAALLYCRPQLKKRTYDASPGTAQRQG